MDQKTSEDVLNQLSKLIETEKPSEVTMGEILKRADEAEIREDVFLHSVCLELQSQASRLRHRALMMRQRANELDEMADQCELSEEAVKEYIFGLMQRLADTVRLLDSYAHIEPQKVKLE